MGRACGMHGGYDKCLQGSGGVTQRKRDCVNFWYLVYEMHIDNPSNYVLYLLFMCIDCICKEL
jgi:hypothetical protein